ncbi:hypothetical protein IR148_17080 [Dysgonomonas mossii]|uniref:ADP ribosyltransferase domain-containing protein n=1 Tax=Dysgonomonas mossii TaxID=163665 RepID=A0A4Y9II20_9BACT|nr:MULTISPECIES: hypothetical protein [Dysgonomonas]MBD8389203.1 hypothetical protein [Dysgonomonas sp. BGC7]MBF0762749.1 hypothetical protein [Dysgonomonas mossii]TFU86285.1 hypothetical protein E4T88_17070 [Dysgonomonas mossii]
MITIEKLLQLEKKYYPNTPDGIVSQYTNGLSIPQNKKMELTQYGITDIEYLIILMFCGNQASIFQQHFIENRTPNELESVLSFLLDSVLDKLPSVDFECLGRFDTYSNIDNYKENSIIKINYYLTVTPHDLGDVAETKMIWLITPLPKEQTQARCIYPIHDLPVPEYQVNFKRNTRFYINKIEQTSPYPLLYVTELKL